VWFVDPEGRTLEVLRSAGESYLLARTFTGDEPVRAEPFDAVDLELGALWRG
jgi:hypothetical protein